MWRIPYVNLGAQFAEEKAELMPRIEAVLAGGMHVGGPEVEALEREIAAYVGTRYAVVLNSGTDALIFATIAAFTAPLAGAAAVAAPPQAEQHHITTDGECHVVTWLNSPATIKYPDCAGD